LLIPTDAFVVAKQAPKGNPDPIPFAVATISGLIFAHSCAYNLPDLPKPD